MKKITNKLLFSGLAVMFVLLVVFMLTMFSSNDKNIDGGNNDTTVFKEDDMAIKQETRELGSFDVIESDGVWDIEIVQSDRSAVEINANEYMIGSIITDVNDGKLKISMMPYINNDVNTRIVVYSQECRIIKNAGVGSITCDSLSVESLRLDNEGVGTIVVNNMKVSKLRVENEGVGSITVSGVAENARLENEAVGMIDASLLECKEIEVSNDGLGKIMTNK